MVIASNKKHIMQNFIHLPIPTHMGCGLNSFSRAIDSRESHNSDIVVPRGHLPVMGHFKGQIFFIDYKETSLTKGQLVYRLKGEEFISEQFDPPSENEGDFRWNDCIVMVPIELLKHIGFEVNTSEGWGWDDEKATSYFLEKPDENHMWNPYVKKWGKMCKDCLKLHHDTIPYQVFNHMTEDDIFGPNADVSLCDCSKCKNCGTFTCIGDCFDGY